MPIVSYGPRAKMTPHRSWKGSKKTGPNRVKKFEMSSQQGRQDFILMSVKIRQN